MSKNTREASLRIRERDYGRAVGRNPRLTELLERQKLYVVLQNRTGTFIASKLAIEHFKSELMNIDSPFKLDIGP